MKFLFSGSESGLPHVSIFAFQIIFFARFFGRNLGGVRYMPICGKQSSSLISDSQLVIFQFAKYGYL